MGALQLQRYVCPAFLPLFLHTEPHSPAPQCSWAAPCPQPPPACPQLFLIPATLHLQTQDPAMVSCRILLCQGILSGWHHIASDLSPLEQEKISTIC